MRAQKRACNGARTVDLVKHGAPIDGESLAHVVSQRLEVICELGELDLQDGGGQGQSDTGHAERVCVEPFAVGFPGLSSLVYLLLTFLPAVRLQRSCLFTACNTSSFKAAQHSTARQIESEHDYDTMQQASLSRCTWANWTLQEAGKQWGEAVQHSPPQHGRK